MVLELDYVPEVNCRPFDHNYGLLQGTQKTLFQICFLCALKKTMVMVEKTSAINFVY